MDPLVDRTTIAIEQVPKLHIDGHHTDPTVERGEEQGQSSAAIDASHDDGEYLVRLGADSTSNLSDQRQQGGDFQSFGRPTDADAQSMEDVPSILARGPAADGVVGRAIDAGRDQHGHAPAGEMRRPPVDQRADAPLWARDEHDRRDGIGRHEPLRQDLLTLSMADRPGRAAGGEPSHPGPGVACPCPGVDVDPEVTGQPSTFRLEEAAAGKRRASEGGQPAPVALGAGQRQSSEKVLVERRELVRAPLRLGDRPERSRSRDPEQRLPQRPVAGLHLRSAISRDGVHDGH